jgi:hypothetical protein
MTDNVSENHSRFDGPKEFSVNIDLDSLSSLLESITELIESGFSSGEAQRVIALARGMSVDEEKSLKFAIQVDGRQSQLTVSLFMDDIDSPDIHFIAEPSLCNRIRSTAEEFLSG